MLIHADARAIPLRDGCVQCVVTSPPYWGLRDYGMEGQIGLERSPEAYVASLVGVFREVWRVIRADGTVWLNLGDSYANDTKWGGQTSGKHALSLHGKTPLVRDKKCSGLKVKDLVGIPWCVAFALQADGWYLRSDIIWAKPNPMPESVTDRPTKAHEYLFLLSKQERYHYDAATIAEPVGAAMLQEIAQGYDGLGLKDYDVAGVQNPSSVKSRIIANARSRETWRMSKRQALGMGIEPTGNEKKPPDEQGNRTFTRNRRTVWTVPTMPYAGSHFATMPEALIEPCILAGCPLGGLVLDPFVGSGTVVSVASRLGRRAVGIDLNPAYHQLAKQRTAQRGLRFTATEANQGCA